MTTSNETVALPLKINLGSGKDFKADHFNIDINGKWKPDAVIDLSREGALDLVYQSARFGEIRLPRDYFEHMVANDVLEHVPALATMMKNCLDIMKPGGIFQISVPYDLSYGAWQDPTHVRAFNEKSWLYYTEWFWYLGWQEARFDLLHTNVQLSQYGVQLQAEGMTLEHIMRQPRAVDNMTVQLQKRLLNDEEKLIVERFLQR